MKTSHLIALIILLAGVSVLVWVGAFSTSEETDITGKPVSSVKTDFLSQTSTPEPTVPPTSSPDDSPAEPTEKPIDINSVDIKNSAFENYDNEFQNWDSYFTTDASDNQNYPYIKQALYEHIFKPTEGAEDGEDAKNVKIIPAVKKEITVGDDVRHIISNEHIDSEQEVYLTFSLAYDTPDDVKTILDLLDKYKIKATFFMMNYYIKAEGNAEIIKRIYDSGHLIGTRGLEEDFMRSCTAEEFANEMKDAEVFFKSVVGDENARMCYYRPEIFSERTLEVAAALGYKVVFKTFVTEGDNWSSDIEDSEGNIDSDLVCKKLFERASYDGSVPELKVNKAVLGAFEKYIWEAQSANITFKLLNQ